MMEPSPAFADHALTSKRPMKTALHQAVLDHRLHQVRLIVTKHEDDVDVQDVFGRTPLMLACLLDNEDDGYRMVNIFLKADAYVNILDHMNRSALHYACMKGKVRIVKKLLMSDTVEDTAPDNDGNTPLIHAALSGNPEVVRVMLDCMGKLGVNVDIRNTMGYTALLLACKYGHYVSAHILLKDGSASPSIRDNEFFMNALDWTNSSSDIGAAFSKPRHRAGSDMPRFSRENTMYAGIAHSVCRHVQPASHPLGMSLDAALRLPSVFNYAVSKEHEMTIDGEDAKPILIKEIEQLLNSPKYRTPSKNKRLSRGMSMVTPGLRSVKSRPATAQLTALQPSNRANMVPNMRTLFDLYSDQYGQDALLKKPGDTGATSVNRLVITHPVVPEEVIVPVVATKLGKLRKSVQINVKAQPNDNTRHQV